MRVTVLLYPTALWLALSVPLLAQAPPGQTISAVEFTGLTRTSEVLVRDVVGNQRVEARVRAIVQLARTMNLKTTAECIESAAIQTAVGALGVDFGQGFAIGRPRPVEQVLQDLLRGSSGVVRPLTPSASARPNRMVS